MSTETNGRRGTSGQVIPSASGHSLGVYFQSVGTKLTTVDQVSGVDSKIGGSSSVALISTFLAAIQVAMLSFMNDLLSKNSLDPQLFQDTEASRSYTLYSLGIMLGTIAQWMYITVAVMTTMEQFPSQIPETPERPALFMVILFNALCASATSLILLHLDFDPAFAVVLTGICLCTLVLALALILQSTNVTRTTVATLGLKENALRIFSLWGLGPIFGLSICFPAPPVWCSLFIVAATLAYHLLSYMPGWADRGAELQGDEEDLVAASGRGRVVRHTTAQGNGETQPRKCRDMFSGFLCVGWAACAVLTATWGVQNHKDNEWAQWTIVAIAICEAGWMGVRAALSFSLHSWLAGFWDKFLVAVSMRHALPR